MNEGPGLKERARQTKAVVNAVAPEMPGDVKAPPATPPQQVDKIHPKAKFGTNKGENRNLPADQWMKPLGQLHTGTPYVPKTGNYTLEQGEAVVPKEKNMADPMALVPGRSEEKPKKEIHEIRTRKAKTGGYIHEHHHTHPEHHKMEEHNSADMKGVMSHMNSAMGDGQSDADVMGAGAPPAGAPPAGAPPAGVPPIAPPAM